MPQYPPLLVILTPHVTGFSPPLLRNIELEPSNDDPGQTRRRQPQTCRRRTPTQNALHMSLCVNTHTCDMLPPWRPLCDGRHTCTPTWGHAPEGARMSWESVAWDGS